MCANNRKNLNIKSFFHKRNQNSLETVTGALKLRSELPFPRGLSHICIPPQPSGASPAHVHRRAGAPPRCEPWTGRSGSTAPGGGGTPSWCQAEPPTEQRGSCTDRSTVCCAPSLCCIPLPSHAVRMTGRRHD